MDFDGDYSEKPVNEAVVSKVREAANNGYEIILHTSRNMRTFNKDIGKINKNTLPILFKWLEQHDIPYDGIIVGKPWCGVDGFYVDDRAIRPSEFTSLTFSEIEELLDNER
jgi:capsule biosynthesis phosphatase